MASGSYTRKTAQQSSSEEGVTTQIPPRATRQLRVPQESTQDDSYNAFETRPAAPASRSLSNRTSAKASPKKPLSPRPQVAAITPPRQSERLVRSEGKPGSYWLKPWVFCSVGAIIFLAILLSAGIFQRPSLNYFFSNNLQAYDIQVGGDQAGSWQHDPRTKILPQSGPYAVLSKPSISADLINQVLSTYKSPAAGKGQALYDLGAEYGIDPAFALAFFMHESTFGTKGEATKSLSLGNLRCIPNFRCEDNFAQFNSWEDGFKAWYQLIRNLYIAQWQLTTVDQIIPKYAPAADNNNEKGYIAALKHAIDTWHANQIIVS
jgi:hypothetical protein